LVNRYLISQTKIVFKNYTIAHNFLFPVNRKYSLFFNLESLHNMVLKSKDLCKFLKRTSRTTKKKILCDAFVKSTSRALGRVRNSAHAPGLTGRCPGSDQALPRLCPCSRQDLLRICPASANAMPMLCPCYAHAMPMLCSCYAHAMLVLCPCYAHVMPMLCPCYAHAMLML
jgi:hypothetical protein